jgi:hypothetical protein
MYKPRYCTDCGDRIERERWRSWHSRQFCELCSPKYRFRRFGMPFVLVGVSILIGYGLRGFVQPRWGRPAPRLEINHNPLRLMGQVAPRKGDKPPDVSPSPDLAPVTRKAPVPVKVCGAPTKRGIPCKRKVRGTGYCYQHRGYVPPKS